MSKDRIIEGIAVTPTVDSHGQKANTAGYRWELPIDLRREHGPTKMGEVLNVWREGEAIHFRARVDNDAIWESIEGGEYRGASVDLVESKGEHVDDAETIKLIREGRISEISVCREPANPDCRFAIVGRHKVVAIPKPQEHHEAASAPASEPSELVSVQSRLKQLERLIPATKELCRTSQGTHDFESLAAAENTLKRLSGERADLLQRKLELETGVPIATKAAPTSPAAPAAPAAPTSPAAPRRRPRAWEYDDLREPDYPEGARQAGDTDTIEARLKEFVDYETNESYKIAHELGLDPDAPISAEVSMTIRGIAAGMQAWTNLRLKELEERVAQVEAGGIKYAGTWQRAQPYSKGSVCTESGAAWIALRAVNEGEKPGTSDAWQLMVKAGKDAR